MRLYYSLNQFFKRTFGEKVKKIPLDAGFSCPNRDGTKGYGGCIYCDARGSGTGLHQKYSLEEQITLFLEKFKVRGYRKFIAYFQSFSNTYGPIEKLREAYSSVKAFPEIIGLALGTRPDCLTPEVIELLKDFQESGYFLWVELGLQSKHDETLKRINRGHSYADFLEAYELLQRNSIPVCVHIIFGLPGETKEMMLETASDLAKLSPFGVKFHALYVLAHTPLAKLYEEKAFRELSLEEYAELVGESLSLLPPETVIHRLTSDPTGEDLLAPFWLKDKRKVLATIETYLKTKGLYQGKYWKPQQ